MKFYLGIVLLSIGTAGVLYPLWWNHRSSGGAASLLRTFSKSITHSGSTGPTGSRLCANQAFPGVLSIPALSLVAPVEQGLDDNVLNIAVGHDPSTSWPGAKAASLFAAHDVSFFSQLGSVKDGNTVTFSTGCSTLVYKVSAINIVKTGTAIALPSAGSLVLDTCYPSNALWYTDQRLIVTATYIKQSKLVVPVVAKVISSNAQNLTANVPGSIPSAELNLANNTQEMGELSFGGTYSSDFVQSDLPLSVEAVALKAWFAVVHSLTGAQPSWWTSFTSASFPNALISESIRSTSPLEITEVIDGTNVSEVILTGGINNHSLSITETTQGTELVVSSIALS